MNKKWEICKINEEDINKIAEELILLSSNSFNNLNSKNKN